MEYAAFLLEVNAQSVREDIFACVKDDDVRPLKPLHLVNRGQSYTLGVPSHRKHLAHPSLESGSLGMKLSQRHEAANSI